MTGYESKKAMAQDKLAQPAQEPVAFVNGRGWRSGNLGVIPEKMNQIFEIYQPLYTTPPQPEQEPVAHQFQTKDGKWYSFIGQPQYETALEEGRLPIRALYTTPPQRPWVDLTENEIEVIEEKALTKQWAIRMALAAVKERNA